MSLPFAPPPGLPFPTLDPLVQEIYLENLQPSLFPHLILPLVTILLIVSFFFSLALRSYLLKRGRSLTWQEELLDPLLGEPSAPLSTSEVISKLFKKDPHLAEKAEPLLFEIDIVRFSSSFNPPEQLIYKTKELFMTAQSQQEKS